MKYLIQVIESNYKGNTAIEQPVQTDSRITIKVTVRYLEPSMNGLIEFCCFLTPLPDANNIKETLRQQLLVDGYQRLGVTEKSHRYYIDVLTAQGESVDDEILAIDGIIKNHYSILYKSDMSNFKLFAIEYCNDARAELIWNIGKT